uniref:CLN6 transmembrane ER protein b n=1 Tax=Mastacembelus armatus TaxID=205130 RepID=A0A3Q3MFK6_9TELE
MHSSVRKRQNSALHAAGFTSRFVISYFRTEAALSKPRFHLDLWLGFIIQNWALDVGQHVAMLVLSADWFPANRPGAAEYLHILYNVTTPLVLLEMLERSPRMLPRLAVRLSIISVVMGTSLHLATDSITRRLVLIGYQLHLSVRENPVMKNIKPSSLVGSGSDPQILFSPINHLIFSSYVPLFLALFLFFSGCFCCRKQETMPAAAWMLLVPNIAYYWYLITEGQTFILFTFTFFAMMATVMHQRRRGMLLDANGLFLLYSFSAALSLVALWVVCLWSDAALRRKHPGLIYVPQPCAVYTLHLRHNNQT